MKPGNLDKLFDSVALGKNELAIFNDYLQIMISNFVLKIKSFEIENSLNENFVDTYFSKLENLRDDEIKSFNCKQLLDNFCNKVYKV